MNPNSVRIANEKVWAAHPELKRRQLTGKPVDGPLRREWRQYYEDAETAAATKPAIAPAVAKPPAAVAPLVTICSPVPPVVKVNDCKEIEKHVAEGDIVVRGERGDPESDAIAKISKCQYSHAGIVARNAKGELVVVDAYPGRGPEKTNTKAVGASSVREFFCDHKATQGMVARPKDCEKAKKAAQWALKESQDPSYKFDLWDPWSKNNKDVYCSDFVYQSFQNAGVDLVPAKMDFLSPANRQNTIDAAREFKGGLARVAGDAKIENEMLKQTGGSSEYITPCQVASNANTEAAVIFDTSSSGSSPGESSKKGKS